MRKRIKCFSYDSTDQGHHQGFSQRSQAAATGSDYCDGLREECYGSGDERCVVRLLRGDRQALIVPTAQVRNKGTLRYLSATRWRPRD
jgi:hypothetical protein